MSASRSSTLSLATDGSFGPKDIINLEIDQVSERFGLEPAAPSLDNHVEIGITAGF